MARRRRIFPAVRGLLEGKAVTLTGGLGSFNIPRVTTLGLRDSAAGWDVDAAVTEGFEQSVWVYKAIDVIAGNASRLPFVIRHGEDEIEDHPLLRVLNKRANPLETGRAFRYRLSAQLLLSKRGAFIEVTRSAAGTIARLDLLDPTRVRIVPDLSGDYVSYFEYTRPDGLVRNLAPEQVRWVRKSHPLDPFSGVTPLDPAGMSVDLDRLARTYNVNFINRDGRPGGVIGVDTDDLDPAELKRIAGLFTPGAQHAGTIHAIGTGKGGMSYIDTSSRPRDMAYETTSEKAKKEILAAFGVPESMAGDSSERTFDNAEQEEFNFWHDPMLPHLELIASAFDGDVSERFDCGFDTSSVEALELPARRRRAEHRDEVEAGLRTIKEYREEAQLDAIDNPQTRALWISPAKAPIPGIPSDAAALGLEDPNAPGGGANPMAPGAGGGPADPNVAMTAQEVVEQALAEDPAAIDAPVEDLSPAEAAVAAARAEENDGTDWLDGEAAAAVAAARMEGKALDVTEITAPVEHTYDPGDEPERQVELAVATALEALLNRQAAVIASRLESPKIRRGTPYFVPEYEVDTRVGEDPIDVARVVDSARWVGEAQLALQPIITEAANEASTGLLAAMAGTGALVGATPIAAVVVGKPLQTAPAAAGEVSAAAAAAAARASLFALATAQLAIEEWLSRRVVDIDRVLTEQVTPDLPAALVEVRKLWETKSRDFSRSLAITVAQTAVGGARDAAAEALIPQTSTVTMPTPDGTYTVTVKPEVLRTWRTRHDEAVRAAHRAADGQTVGLGEHFRVGGHELRWPSDPLAPPEVSRNCRCWVSYTWSEGATFTVERNDVTPSFDAAA